MPLDQRHCRRILASTLSLLTVLSLLGSPLPPARAQTAPDAISPGLLRLSDTGETVDPTATFRTRVTWPNAYGYARLKQLGVQMLSDDEDGALVLATEEQLEDLARLSFRPQRSDDLAALMGGAGLSLSGSISLDSIGLLISPDDDADGLTNTEESWWGTDPLCTDSDGDGATDGAEVAALLAWLRNETATYPATGRPFQGWPTTTTSACDATRTFSVPDGDWDGVPDLAERWMLGLSMNRESTDRDKFDDGQELYGITKWAWGALPRAEDTGYIFAEMPAWVKVPGNHPLCAAFPVPEVDMVESSLRVAVVTVLTDGTTTVSGVEKSYSTSHTDGVSTARSDTVTWNDWEEVTDTRPVTPAGSGTEATSASSPAAKKVSARSATTRRTAKPSWTTTDVPLGGLDTALQMPNLVGGFVEALDEWSVEGLYLLQTHGGFWNWSGHLDEWDELEARDRLATCQRGETCRDPVTGQLLLDGGQYALDQSAQDQSQDEMPGGSRLNTTLTAEGASTSRTYPVEIKVALNSVPTRSESRGSSWGGALTTTSSEYAEDTVTSGEAIFEENGWSTATAVDSSHSADLWFTYKVSNTGTDYAREIGDLAFNVYIGEDPSPAYTYFVGSDLGGDGMFHNYMPGEEHVFSAKTNSHAVPLSLDQLKAVDLGGPIRIVVEDFTYGNDELFYLDALNSGVVLAIEDGTDDGDEAIDTYLVPTWGEETVPDVLARYFPHEVDADGNLIAIWTPEQGLSSTPAWCNDCRVTGTTRWCKHTLSTVDWWNIYTDGMGDGSEGFQDTPAVAGATALFRLNKDTDLDGYSDRSETRLDTDPQDAGDYPRPELLAGVHSIRNGNLVTDTLSLLNIGLYDAYGVEAIMVAPDDSISITNNTVGGSGRVKATKGVVVGSRILEPAYTTTTWTGTAQPATGGYYSGTQDRTYTFTVQCATTDCSVSSGSWNLAWSDGLGASGTLAFGSTYKSPNLLSVGAFGVKVGLLSGTVKHGNTFTVEARTPRDTFQYTINRWPHSEPIVVVSYNDPQGNHRFIIPPEAMDLDSPSDDLVVYAGQMLQDPGVEIVTRAPLGTTGVASETGCSTCAQQERLALLGEGVTQTTDLVVNNPTGVSLTDAHLFVEFVNITGTVASEVPVTVTLPAGPSVVPVEWSTEVFSPTYQADEDYIVMAFLTDYQGNILDSAARPLSSFQDDPRPTFEMCVADATWDFGTAAQGTVLKHAFTVADVGETSMLTYVSAAEGLTLSQTGSRTVGPADTTTYEITLNTATLPLGAYDRTITLRTSDPSSPTRSVRVLGSIIAGTADTPTGAVQRPLDWPLAITGSYTQGEQYPFAHTLGPDAQTLHPVKVYSEDYSKLWGVGKVATDFGAGTASAAMFGDGRDGSLSVASGSTVTINTVRTNVTASGTTAKVSSSSGFAVGDLVLLHQTQGSANVGRWEYATIASISGTTWTLTKALAYSYTSSSAKAQAVKVPQYHNLTVEAGATLTVPAWDGATGGILAVRCSGTATVAGTITVSGKGFRGGAGGTAPGPSVIDGGNATGGKGGEGAAGWTGAGGGGRDGTARAPGHPAGGAGNSPNDGGYGSGGNSQLYFSGGGGGGGKGRRPDYWDGGNAATGAGGGGGGGHVYGGGGGAGGNSQNSGPVRVGGASNGSGGGGGAGANANGGASGQPGGANGGTGGAGGASYCSGGGGWGAARNQGSHGGGGGSDVPYAIDLSRMFFGGGGGGGGARDHEYDGHYPGWAGRNGAGAIALSASTLSVTGNVSADGSGYGGVDHSWAGCGGAGAGGSILIQAGTAALGSGRVTASGASGGYWRQAGGGIAGGGNSSIGVIRVEFCEQTSGSTNPPASAQKLTCYICEQVESSPFTSGKLVLPESFSSGRTYQVQYGRRLVYTAAGSQATTLRLPAGPLAGATLDALVSGVGTGTLTLRLDIGNDGSWDWTHTGSMTDYATLNSPTLAVAINNYWATHGAPTTGTLDVPVKASLSKAGQVLLTNMQVSRTGSKVRTVRLPARTYTAQTLDLTVSGSSGPLTVGLDVGNKGSVDWVYTGTPTWPAQLTTANLATAFNAYLSGRTGEVDVPLRVYLAPFTGLSLRSYSATPTAKPDLTLTASDIAFGAIDPTEGTSVPIAVTLHNAGTLDSGGVTAALTAESPDWGPLYVGSCFVDNVPAGGTATGSIQWNTLGFTSTVPISVTLDAWERLPESNEDNNVAGTVLDILSRPDLRVSGIVLSDDEPVVGQEVSIEVTQANAGRTPAAESQLRLFAESADGPLLGELAQVVPALGQTTSTFTWTPTAPGSHRLYLVGDATDVVWEYDEGNNETWRDVYVGFKGPILVDSGSAADLAYTAERGYGYVDEGQTDVTGTECGSQPRESFRRDPGGRIVYRFDHLLPGHYYHLDVTLFECDGAGRLETISVNGTDLSGPHDLLDGAVHRVSTLLDPALYAANSISVTITADPTVDGAVVSEVNLHDIDYRYADAGGGVDPAYPGTQGYGWLEGVPNSGWGTLPFQSVRINQSANTLRYRFDGLDHSKRYNVRLTFYQGSGGARIQKVQIDGADTGLTVDTGDYAVHSESVSVPATAYLADGSIVVVIVRTNASTGAMVNEIALEEETATASTACDAPETPFYTDVYGSITIDDAAAPEGTVVQALSPRGETVGCFTVGSAGIYGFMRLFGEDVTANPPIPGMRAGELVEFRVNGAPAVSTPAIYWQADSQTHRVDLAAGGIVGQSVFMAPGWNLVSFHVAPPVPTVERTLNSIQSRYDMVLGEKGAWVASLPTQHNTLRELLAGDGYYVRVSGTTSVSALIEGLPVECATPLPLHAGWNWIGYFPDVTMPITVALASIEGHYQRVHGLSTTYDPALPEFSTLTTMKPGEGYLIYANDPVTLTYPCGVGASVVLPSSEPDLCQAIMPTPWATIVYGHITINGRPAPVGTRVDILTPRGEVAGCCVVTDAGLYGMTDAYGADDSASPPIPGFADGEPVTFRVNGWQARTSEALSWESDLTPHRVDLSVTVRQEHLPLIVRGW